MIDKSRYGEGLACRDMADGALVIIIEGTRGDVTRRGPHTHQATGAFVGTSVTRGWDREDLVPHTNVCMVWGNGRSAMQ